MSKLIESAGQTVAASSTSAANDPAIHAAQPRLSDELPHGKRADLACRAARDIAEIVRLLSLQPNDKPRPAVLGRVHALACAIDSLMSDDMDGVSDIHARLYPHDGGQAHA